MRIGFIHAYLLKLSQISIFFILLSKCYSVNPKNQGYGSLVSLDDYYFSGSHQFYSKYFDFLNSNTSNYTDLKLSSSISSLFEGRNESFYRRGTLNENVLLLTDETTNSYLSKIQVFKENDKMLHFKNYSIEYTSETPIISNFNFYHAPYTPKNENYEIKCKNLLHKVIYDARYAYTQFDQIIKIDSHLQYNFILTNTKDLTGTTFKQLTMNYKSRPESRNAQIQEVEFNEVNFNQIKNEILNFWILKMNHNNLQENNDTVPNEIFLALATKKSIYLYILADTISFFSKIDYQGQIPGGSSIDNLKITKVGLWNDILIVGSYENGLNFFEHYYDIDKDKHVFVYKNSFSNFYGKKDRNLYNFNILDFIINKKTIYAIIEHFGLKIYSLGSNQIVDFELYHPYLKSFDIPYGIEENNEKQIIGLNINNLKSDINEFYMELNISDEEHPLINRLYSSGRELGISSSYSTELYTHIFDKYTFNLYIMKKVSAISPILIYKLNLSEYFKRNENIFNVSPFAAIRDNGEIVKGLLFIDSTSNKFVFISSIEYGYNTLKCTFNDSGTYLINFSFMNDKPIEVKTNSGNKIELSRHVNYFLFRILIVDELIYIWSILGIVIGCVFIMIILVIVLKCRKKKDEASIEGIRIMNELKNTDEIRYSQAPKEKDNIEMPIKDVQLVISVDGNEYHKQLNN